jgi:hypothetical protein
MTKYTYKNITDHNLSVIGFGVVKSGKTITSNVEINNVNLEPVTKDVAKSEEKAPAKGKGKNK